MNNEFLESKTERLEGRKIRKKIRKLEQFGRPSIHLIGEKWRRKSY